MAPKTTARTAVGSSSPSSRRGSSAGSSTGRRGGSTSAKARGRSSKSSVGRPGAASEGAASQAAPAPPDPQAIAATKLQAAARGHLGRKYAKGVREAHEAAQRQLAEAVRAAENSALREARRLEEEADAREAERQRKKRELEQNTMAMVAAAFDGELEQVAAMLRWGVPVDAENRRGVTALSEAACGGATKVVLLLLAGRSDPNIRGEFGRSPLWRACYQGHAEVVAMLLENGADPRIGSDGAELPVDVTTSTDVEAALRSWDISRTDVLVGEYKAWKKGQEHEAEQTRAKAMKSVEAELQDAHAGYVMRQKELAHLKAELRRRITEYDICMTEKKLASVLSGLRRACESVEARILVAERNFEAARGKLDAANVKRMVAAEENGVQLDDEIIGRAVVLKDLDDVLIRDIGGRIATATRWPMLVDTSDCATQFLQYSGNAVLNCWCAEEMQPDRIRRALLTMLRGGGVLAINLLFFGGVVGLAELAEPFDAIRPGLFNELLTRKLLLPESADPTGLPSFYGLVDKDKDGDIFEHFGFAEDKAAKFKFLLLTSSTLPHEELIANFDVMRLVMQPDGAVM